MPAMKMAAQKTATCHGRRRLTRVQFSNFKLLEGAITQ